MPSNDRFFEEPDDEFLENELPAEDLPDDDLSETVPCQECGAEVYEDAVRCPSCGNYLTHQNHLWSRRPTWWIILGLLGILGAILAWLLSSMG